MHYNKVIKSTIGELLQGIQLMLMIIMSNTTSIGLFRFYSSERNKWGRVTKLQKAIKLWNGPSSF